MSNNTKETIQTESLSEKVQYFRDKAREILRMENINRVLQDKFYIGQETKRLKEELEYIEKNLAITEYKITKLDEADPEYKDKLKGLEVNKKSHETNIENRKEMIAKQEKQDAERLEKIDEKIEKIESGEIKVNINSVNAIANKMINKFGTMNNGINNSYVDDNDDEEEDY